MNPWDFGWDAIAALAGVLAVVVAAVLGWLGIRLAARAVHRSKLDYIGQRADVVADQLERLRILYGELDTALLPFWGWDQSGGDRPDGAPVHGKLLELHAACDSVLLAARGLAVASNELGGRTRADRATAALDALNIATYVAVVYFTNGKNANPREGLKRFYENELKIYDPDQRDAIRVILQGVDANVGVPNTVTTVARHTLGNCTAEVEDLVIKAFVVAGTDIARTARRLAPR